MKKLPRCVRCGGALDGVSPVGECRCGSRELVEFEHRRLRTMMARLSDMQMLSLLREFQRIVEARGR
jgi:hypothetical protein